MVIAEIFKQYYTDGIMKEVFFDIEKYSYIVESEADVSFIPMLTRRKLDKFGRAALYTLYNVCGSVDRNIVFASAYGDFERVKKLISQRKEEGEVSPSGFSSSVHNAAVGLFSLLKKNKKSYNSISAGNETVAAGLLESILTGESIYCYAEDLSGVKSVALSIKLSENGQYVLSDNSDIGSVSDSYNDLISFITGKSDLFVSRLYKIRRIK